MILARPGLSNLTVCRIIQMIDSSLTYIVRFVGRAANPEKRWS